MVRHDGELTERVRPDPFRPDGVENLTYNNPLAMEIERAWFDGKVVFAVESGYRIDKSTIVEN